MTELKKYADMEFDKYKITQAVTEVKNELKNKEGPKTKLCSNTHIANSPSPAKKTVQMPKKKSQCANPMSAANVINICQMPT